MDRSQKREVVESVKQHCENYEYFFCFNYKHSTVETLESFRNELDGKARVVKNSLLKIALADSKFNGIPEVVNGQVLSVFTNDLVGTAKLLCKYAKDHESINLLAVSDGSSTGDDATIEAFSKMPSLDETRAKIIGLLSAPQRSIMSVINAPATRIMMILSEKSKQ